MTTNRCYQLVILETSDLHCNIVPYDYYNDKKSEFFGLAKTATIIKKFKNNCTNTVLVDNGDLIQGNALSDFINRKAPLAENQIHPIIKVMNYLRFDLATVGNHDFNYGLDFLFKVANQANFPFICSNLFHYNKNLKNHLGKSLFPENFILEKKLDNEEIVKIGFIGVAPPQILIWDKHILHHKVAAIDMVLATKQQAKLLKKMGADIVVVLAHSGIFPIKYVTGCENAVCELTKIKEVDVVLSGHAHNVFPGGKVFNNLEKYKIINQTGKINGKPVVMPGALGSHLGVIRLELTKKRDKWKINQSFAEVHNVRDVEPDSHSLALVSEENNKVLSYIRSEVGRSSVHFNSWFSTLQISYASQFIQKTVLEFGKILLKNTKWENLPILCAFAPLNTGSHGSFYINIPKGPLAIKDISNLYPYDNEIKILLTNGDQLKTWLEFGAQIFTQIDVTSSIEINILSPHFPAFNFDCIYGITYEIDITKPYGKRIINLCYNKLPIKSTQKFSVVTNNYRAAGGGNFPNLHKLKSLVETTQLYRDIVIEKVKEQPEINVTLEENWRIHPILSGTKQKIFFESSSDSIPFHPKFLTLLSKDEKLKKAKYLVDITKF